MVPSVQQPLYYSAAHQSQTDETEVRHL
jgi:hypothetical protein